jgi:hypothetical protein
MAFMNTAMTHIILPEFYEEYNLAVQGSEERMTSILGAER